jgi:hypothetical protein
VDLSSLCRSADARGHRLFVDECGLGEVVRDALIGGRVGVLNDRGFLSLPEVRRAVLHATQVRSSRRKLDLWHAVPALQHRDGHAEDRFVTNP